MVHNNRTIRASLSESDSDSNSAQRGSSVAASDKSHSVSPIARECHAGTRSHGRVRPRTQVWREPNSLACHSVNYLRMSRASTCNPVHSSCFICYTSRSDSAARRLPPSPPSSCPLLLRQRRQQRFPATAPSSFRGRSQRRPASLERSHRTRLFPCRPKIGPVFDCTAHNEFWRYFFPSFTHTIRSETLLIILEKNVWEF